MLPTKLRRVGTMLVESNESDVGLPLLTVSLVESTGRVDEYHHL